MLKVKIDSLEQLIELSTNCQLDCFISLAGGLARSSKDIYYYPETKQFEVFHGIDGHTETYNHQELLASNIGEALVKGALFAY